MKQITSTDIQSEVLAHKGVVLVDFYADWCGPCKILSPILEGIEKDLKDSAIKLVKLNVDENQEVASLYNVMSIPTVMIFKDGTLIGQQVGVAPKDVYKEALLKAREMTS